MATMELSDSGYLEAPTLDWLLPCSGAPAGQILPFLGLPLGAQALGRKHSHGEFPPAGGAEAAGLGGSESLPGSEWSRVAGSWDLAGFSATYSRGGSGGAPRGQRPAHPAGGPSPPGDKLSTVRKECVRGGQHPAVGSHLLHVQACTRA